MSQKTICDICGMEIEPQVDDDNLNGWIVEQKVTAYPYGIARNSIVERLDVCRSCWDLISGLAYGGEDAPDDDATGEEEAGDGKATA